MQWYVRQRNKPFDMAGDKLSGRACAISGRITTHGVTGPSANAAATMDRRIVRYPHLLIRMHNVNCSRVASYKASDPTSLTPGELP